MELILQQRFRDIVNELLDARGITRSDLADTMGVHKTFVSSYLNGVRSPGLDVVERFATALEVDPLRLLGGEPARQKNSGRTDVALAK